MEGKKVEITWTCKRCNSSVKTESDEVFFVPVMLKRFMRMEKL